MKKMAHLALLVLAGLALMGSTQVIETGPGRVWEGAYTGSDYISATDSLVNWQYITSVVIEETTGSAAADVGLWLRSGFTSDITVSAGATLTLPIEFLSMDRIKTHTTKPDTVVHIESGSVRIYLVGG